MKKLRIIPRLDVKGMNVIKGIHLEGLRIVGKPAELAKRYYEQGADEILYMDVVASLYGRENILEIVKETTSLGVFIPITVGGGIRTLEDIKKTLRAGADKVAINTFAIKNPEFVKEASKMFGAQCIVGSIEAKKTKNKWEAYIENGREKTGLDAIDWAKKLVELGAGELLITSIDQEGTEKGYDLELIKKIVSEVSVPVIACGGAKNSENIRLCLEETKCDAVALASLLHYNETTVSEIKKYLKEQNLEIRKEYKKIESPSGKARKKVISIVDYGLGNLQSVVKGFEKVGNSVKIVNTPEEIFNAENLVLPGVGAFEDGMKGLRERNLIESIEKHVELKKPFLGICLGAQLLFSESEEFGIHNGLNLIKGKVVKFKKPDSLEKKYLIPHIGWNSISFPKDKKSENILKDISPNSEMYFVHSFILVPENKEDILATTIYGEQEFCSLVKKNNIYGCQFHPEKSGEAGLKILEAFGTM